jgi:hypothetical protein
VESVSLAIVGSCLDGAYYPDDNPAVNITRMIIPARCPGRQTRPTRISPRHRWKPIGPVDGRWSDAQHAEHAAEGRRLAGRLKRERPDLMVYVMEADIGIVEIHADEP